MSEFEKCVKSDTEGGTAANVDERDGIGQK
jgi:hypothetical protein